MSKERSRVAVLMGGKTPEHEISLISGREVVRALGKKNFEVLPLVISRNGTSWKLTSPEKLLSLPDPLSIKGTAKELVTTDYSEIDGAGEISAKGIGVVFIAMHGPFGEDGTVQGMLELTGVPYTGPGVLASALGMDKLRFRKVLKAEEIPFPKFIALKQGDSMSRICEELGSPPYFVKPNNQGSSVGVTFVKEKKDMKKALNSAFDHSEIALVDEYIQGIEITCAVIGNENPEALPVVEIVPKNDFFDYDAKYASAETEEIVPARISNTLTKKVQDIAIRVYHTVGAKGFSRVDMVLKDGKEPVVLEINTIPGLTPMSLFPKAAKAAGMDYPTLIEEIVKLAEERK